MSENSTQGERLTLRDLSMSAILHSATFALAVKQRDLAEEQLEALTSAATALCEAGRWHYDRPVDESALWEALRDALGREKGNAPK